MTPARTTEGRPPAIPKRATTRPMPTASHQLRSAHRRRPAGLPPIGRRMEAPAIPGRCCGRSVRRFDAHHSVDSSVEPKVLARAVSRSLAWLVRYGLAQAIAISDSLRLGWGQGSPELEGTS
jgi:hypothetical protein